jgi:hypothetical protein
MNKFKHHVISAFFGSLLCIIFVNVVVSFIPITFLMSVNEWKSTRSHITAEVMGYKVRDCQVVKGSFVGWVYSGEAWREIPFEFVNDSSPNSSKPATFDKQSFGSWRWHTQPRDGKSVKMTMQHSCNGAIQTTSIGPFEYRVR